MSNQSLHDKILLCECRLPPPPPALPQQDPHVRLSSYAFLNPPLPLDIPISPPHQYMLAGLQKVTDTERSEHTAIHPAVPSPVSTPPSHYTCEWKPRQGFQEGYFFVFNFFLGFNPVKSRERDVRNELYFAGRCDELDQLLFGIGN